MPTVMVLRRSPSSPFTLPGSTASLFRSLKERLESVFGRLQTMVVPFNRQLLTKLQTKGQTILQAKYHQNALTAIYSIASLDSHCLLMRRPRKHDSTFWWASWTHRCCTFGPSSQLHPSENLYSLRRVDRQQYDAESLELAGELHVGGDDFAVQSQM